MDPKRVSIVLTVFLVIAFLASIVGAHLIGTSSRTYATVRSLAQCLQDAPVVDTAAELFERWRRSGLRGRRLVHASAFLHFVPADEDEDFDGLDTFPIRTFDLPGSWVRRIDARNFLWLAVRTGIVRAVDHVLPPDELDRRLAGLAPDATGVWLEDRRIVTHDQGSRRTIADRLPDLDESVLVAVDASYLKTQTVAAVLDRLRASRLTSDLVILCRSADNPDVGAAERRRLDELAEAVR